MKDIPGYENKYAVTEEGQIWSYRSKKFLKQRKRKDGYCDVCLSKDNKKTTLSVHRITAMTYIPNPNNLPQVGHRDETRDNNCVDNLYWTDAKENSNTPLHIERVKKAQCKSIICVESGKVYPSAKAASIELGINHSHICGCCRGERKTCGGLHWRYYE